LNIKKATIKVLYDRLDTTDPKPISNTKEATLWLYLYYFWGYRHAWKKNWGHFCICITFEIDFTFCKWI